VHAHPEFPCDETGQDGGLQLRTGRQLLPGPGQDRPGELVTPAGPGPGRHQALQPGGGQGSSVCRAEIGLWPLSWCFMLSGRSPVFVDQASDGLAALDPGSDIDGLV
jgi:hypothetical protein